MRRHIKYKAVLSADNKEVLITIIAQSHREDSFAYKSYSFVHAGYAICSDTCPAWEGDRDRCYLRGYDKNRDNSVIHLPIEHYQKFKATVLAYNEKFKGERGCAI